YPSDFPCPIHSPDSTNLPLQHPVSCAATYAVAAFGRQRASLCKHSCWRRPCSGAGARTQAQAASSTVAVTALVTVVARSRANLAATFAYSCVATLVAFTAVVGPPFFVLVGVALG